MSLSKRVVLSIPFVFAIGVPWIHRLLFENFMRALPNTDTGAAHFLVVVLSVVGIGAMVVAANVFLEDPECAKGERRDG